MKARLKYPIFSFAPKGNMIYVFRKEELYTTTNTELLKKRKNYIVVDATGTKYVEKGAHKVKWQGIFGYCIRMQGRVISIEYEYGDNPEPFPLRKLQELVAERYPKTRWFKEECWNSADEFRQAIFACKTFEEVADILMPERKTSVWQRIEEYFPVKDENAEYDPMLQRMYKGLNQEIFTVNIKPQPIVYIENLEEYNEKEGLALSREEMDYLLKVEKDLGRKLTDSEVCLLYTSPSPRDCS